MKIYIAPIQGYYRSDPDPRMAKGSFRPRVECFKTNTGEQLPMDEHLYLLGCVRASISNYLLIIIVYMPQFLL